MYELDSRSITKALYRVISQPAGRRDWESIRHYFHSAATMTRTGSAFDAFPSNRCMSFDDYIANVETNLDGAVFDEVETGHHCDRFGSVAQVRSTYETVYRAGSTEIRSHGVNFIILAFLEDSWKILAIAWDNERAGLSLPDEWLDAR